MNKIVTPLPKPVFRDVATTILPIEFSGRVVHLEARAYEDAVNAYQAMALIHRLPNGNGKPLPVVRVHSGCMTGDIFRSQRCDCHGQLQKALGSITESEYGIIVYLPHHEGRGIGLVNKIKAYAEQDRGLDTVDANLSIGSPIDGRDYEFAANILKDLDCRQVRLITNNPAKVMALRSFGVEVVEQLETVVSPSDYNARYLKTKKDRMDHKL